MKRDPSVQQLLRGELLASSPLGYERARAEMLEALFDLLPSYTQRDHADPGIALIEALAATLDIFGFYHDRFLTESKIGSAQSLQSVKLLGDTVGYMPLPALAAKTLQFFEARTVGVILAGSKLAGRTPDVPGKVIFETVRSLVIGPAFNRMALDPNVTRHVGALRAVIRRFAAESPELVTPLDEFAAGSLAMINGSRGLELVPVAGARTRALAVARPLRRSYSLDDTRIHRATEYRHLLHPLPLAEKADDSSDRVVFEVCDRPILHVPAPAGPQRLQSTLELYVFPLGIDPRDPTKWTADRRWQEVPDFTASEAADRHYRTFVDDRLRTYVILRRKMGYRDLLSPEELANVYVRFTPAIGRITDAVTVAPEGHLVELNDEYFTSPLVLPKVDGRFVKTDGSLWVVTDRSLDLLPGRQIIIENSATQEKFIRTLGPRTTGQYLSWKAPEAAEMLNPRPKPVALPPQYPLKLPLADAPLSLMPLWQRVDDAINSVTDDRAWLKGLFLQTFGYYFPLHASGPKARIATYHVLPGRGVMHGIVDELLFVEDIPQMHDDVPGWSSRGALSISPLREAAKAGPYHLWDQFYREFENLDWQLRRNDPDGVLALVTKAPSEGEPLGEVIQPWYEDLKARYPASKPVPFSSVTIVPRGSTFVIVQDTSLIRPGDYFLLGKRFRLFTSVSPEPADREGFGATRDVVLRPAIGETPANNFADTDTPTSFFDPHWLLAEILQAVEVHGKIVKLRWPVQNNYAVDFIMDGSSPTQESRLEQPVTELIVVPQVASVFYGEKFVQKVTLTPNSKVGDKPGTNDQLFFTIKDPFKVGSLRTALDWSIAISDGDFEARWDDLFFASLVGQDELKSATQTEIDADPTLVVDGKSLVWRLFAGVTFGGLKPKQADIVGLYYTEFSKDKGAFPTPQSLYLPFQNKANPRRYTVSDVTFYEIPHDLEKLWAEQTWQGQSTLKYWAKLEDGLEIAIEGWVRLNAAPEGDPTRQASFTCSAGKENETKVNNLFQTMHTIVRMKFDDTDIFGKIVRYMPDTDEWHVWTLDDRELPEGVEPTKLTVFAVDGSSGGAQAIVLLEASGFSSDPPVFVDASQLVDVGSIRPKYPDKKRFNAIEVLENNSDTSGYDAVAKWIAGQSSQSKTYRYFSNRKGELDKTWYDDAEESAWNFFHSKLLGASVGALKVDDTTSLTPGPFVLFSKAHGSQKNDRSDAIVGVLDQKLALPDMKITDSIVFNSGNFIPVRYNDPELDGKIVDASIDVELKSFIGDGGEEADKQAWFTYESDLNKAGLDGNHYNHGKTPEGTFTLNFFSTAAAYNPSSAEIEISVNYTAEPYQGQDEPHTREAEYNICEGEDPVHWKEARFYQFETRPLPWNPLRQLVIMNSGELQAGDYIFIDPAGVSKVSETPCKAAESAAEAVESEEDRSRDHIQWTRVVEVDGRMVIVDPPVKIQPRGFYHYRVTGYRRPAGAASPDEDYYKLLQSEDNPEATTPPELDGLSFGNRLMLKPFVTPSEQAELVGGDGKGATKKDRSEPKPVGDGGEVKTLEHEMLLEHLVPGDRLLVWDRRWRDAWRAHREKGLAKVAGKSWVDWPDRQHEVVIKRIVPKLGLVELEEPLPARFGVEYLFKKSGELDMVLTRASVKAFRALPFYREPFQGKRELIVLGDGDRRSKFARFTAGVRRDFGLASVALQQAGTVASNIEVLTVERASGRWERWTEFGAIDAARRQDQAFVLGLEWPERQDDPCAEFRLELQEEEDEDPCWCAGEGAAVTLPALPIELPLVGLPALPIPLPLVDPAAPPIELPLEYPAAVSVSFGDGEHGQTPPNGRGNVFIRPVEIEPWCRHVPTRVRQRILTTRRDCLPLRIDGRLASARNLVVEVEHSVHEAWQPRGEKHHWRAPLIVEVDLTGLTIPENVKTVKEGEPPRTLVRLRGISDAEAVAGYDGVVVRPLRPGASALSVALPGDIYEPLKSLSQDQILARVEVFEVPGSEVWVLDDQFYEKSMKVDATVSPGAETVLLAETEGLDEDSSLAFSQGGEPGGPVEVVAVRTVDHATYSATLDSPLSRTYRLDRSYLFGNLVEAVQGDSERLVIGSGDGSTRGMRLPLNNRQTLLFSSDEAGALAPGVVLLVDDVRWERVEEFEDRGPRDRIYRLEFEADGGAYVRFGDGVHGAIPAAGFDNIVVVLRTGDGARGNLDAGAIDKLLDGNLAVERTRNVTPAAGGKAADDPAAARQHLMERSFTLGRVVTRDDVVRALRALANVSQARLDPAAAPEVLRAVVALTGRRPATAFDLEVIRERVIAVMPLAPEIKVELVDVEQLSVHLLLEITVQAGFAQGEALQALERAFSAGDGGFFDLERWPIGAPLRAGDVYEQAFSLPAVATARIRWMSREVPPTDLPAKVPDVLRPGPMQVIRCDNDRSGDPNGTRGTLRVRIKGGAA